MTPPPPRSKNRPGRPRGASKAEDVRDRLLREATRLFSERGFESVGLRELAAEAGVTPAMVAYYFGDKQGLYRAMFDELFSGILDFVTQSLEEPEEAADPADPAAALVRLLDLNIQTLARNPWAPRLILREITTPGSPLLQPFVEQFAGPMIRMLPALIRREMGNGALRSDLDPLLSGLSLIGMALYPYLAHPALGEVGGYQLDDDFRDRLTEHCRRLFLEGATPRNA